jgi:GTP-binding protein HflX
LYHQQWIKTGKPVALPVGYTSPGKTTLLGLLAGEHGQTSNKLFTTLVTITRLWRIGNREILLADAVGIISSLPTYMIDAFKSTL